MSQKKPWGRKNDGAVEGAGGTTRHTRRRDARGHGALYALLVSGKPQAKLARRDRAAPRRGWVGEWRREHGNSAWMESKMAKERTWARFHAARPPWRGFGPVA